MNLPPVRVLDRVIEEYREYLLTQFRAKDRMQQPLTGLDADPRPACVSATPVAGAVLPNL